jgi:hypothetical protein
VVALLLLLLPAPGACCALERPAQGKREIGLANDGRVQQTKSGEAMLQYTPHIACT